jgi:hypothetical protein
MTRGWKKGVGNWASTSVFVRLGSAAGDGSTNDGEGSMSWISPGISQAFMDGFDAVVVVRE